MSMAVANRIVIRTMVKIYTLAENTAFNSKFASEHGLSLYIETDSHKILFDSGQTDVFIKNAALLGVDLSKIDIAILSHGHYDHGGGFERFLEINQTASIYINENAVLDNAAKVLNSFQTVYYTCHCTGVEQYAYMKDKMDGRLYYLSSGKIKTIEGVCIMEQKFFICEHCGNIIVMVKNSGVPVMCCGQKMTEIIPGTTDAAVEKHVPVYEVKDNKVFVKVGSVEHPMIPEHYIEWVSIQTKFGNQRKMLNPGDKPEVCFAICEGDEVEAVYAYCNLHSLWKA